MNINNQQNNSEISLNTALSKYSTELSEDVHLTIGNLREKALLTSSIWAKWLSHLYHEKENAEKIVDAKLKLICLKMSNSKMTDSVLRLKTEDKLAQNDERILKLNKLAKMTQDNIDFIERALNILASFGFSIKNVMEVVKLLVSH